jgi:hypothetical protein
LKNLDKLLYAGEPNADELYTGDLKLLGTWEVAHYLGTEKSRIARWITNDAIPAPVARLKSGPFWTVEQVRKKAAQMFRQEQRRSHRNSTELEEWLNERRARRNGVAPSVAA